MPTRTFINLPKEKRIRILKAAKKEFSRVPLDKAVIANIVKDAKIPRGSFYQYFENVDDLFTYLLHYQYGVDKRKFFKHLEQTDNDVYEALKINFSEKIDKLTISENRQFRINVIKTLLEDGNKTMRAVANNFDSEDYLTVDYFPEEVKKSDKFNHIIKLIGMITKNCIEKYLLKKANVEEIKTDYNRYIDFIKLGFTKVFN